jgi:ABC-type multidrug transport system fused ATPase/permease subunit
MRTFRRLLGFLRPYRRPLAVSLLLAWLAMGMTVLIPLLIGSAVNAIESEHRDRILPLVLALLGAGILRLGLTVGRRLIAGKVSLAVEFDLRQVFYEHLQKLELAFFDSQQTGQLMSRATVDLQSIRFFLGYGLIFFFQHVFTVVGVGVLVFVISWKLALIALAVAPVMVAIAYRYSNVSHPVLRDVQQKMADVATVAEENVVGVHVVKSFAQEHAEQPQIARRSEALL